MHTRKRQSDSGSGSIPPKKLSKSDREKLICKQKLDALAQSETLISVDRFSLAEKQCLLEGYKQCGFQVFQDMKLLHKFIPNRRESDLKGMVQRLKTGLQSVDQIGDEDEEDSLDCWRKLCQSLMGTFARNKRVNLDDALADSLIVTADSLPKLNKVDNPNDQTIDLKQPDYPELLKSFAQLLAGKFPDNMTPANAKVSIKLFDHINNLADSIKFDKASMPLASDAWLKSATDERRCRQEIALKGLSDFEKLAKKCPTLLDLEENKNIEALCLELPKIKRITEVLNPLHINESLVSDLMNFQIENQ